MDIAILASCCYCNKLPQGWWLKTTHVYYLTVLQVRSPKWVSLGYNQNIWQAAFLLEALGGSISLPFPAFRDCPHALDHQPLLPSSKPAMAG